MGSRYSLLSLSHFVYISNSIFLDLEGYNDTMTLRENIIKKYGRSDYFHIINVFLWQAKFLPELVEMSNESNVMEMHDESWCISGDGTLPPLSSISSFC